MKNQQVSLKPVASALAFAALLSIGLMNLTYAQDQTAEKKPSLTKTVGERSFSLTGEGETSIEPSGQYVKLAIGKHTFLAEPTTLRYKHNKIVKLSPATKEIAIDISGSTLTVTLNGKEAFKTDVEADKAAPETPNKATLKATAPKVATKPEMQIRVADEAAFFAALDLERPELAGVKTAAQAKNWAAAKQAWAKHLETRTTPQWSWAQRDKAKIIALLGEKDGGLTRYIKPADEVVARQFNPQGVPYQLEKNIDWRLKRGEETHVLSRFAYWRDMGLAYWQTKDAKYASDFTYILKDWLTDNPTPTDLSLVIKSGQPWRSLEAGIRVVNWWETMQLFMDAPEFDAEAKYQMSKSLIEHARYLYLWTPKFRGGNWQVTEAGGVAITGIMLPEAKESAAWRERGLTRLTEHMEKDILPDGGHSELTPSYHQWVLEQFALIAQLCKVNKQEVAGLTARHEKMYEWLMKLSQPNRIVPAIGDTHDPLNIEDTLATGALLYNRGDMRYLGAKDGPASWVWLFGADAFARYKQIQPRRPDFNSVRLLDSNYMVMRSGWEKDDKQLLFDGAPGGVAHHHQDRLQVTLHAGRDLLIDPGIYSYNQPLAQTYFKLAEAHNVLLIDGKGSPRSKDVASFPKVLSWQTTAQADFASGSTEFDGFKHQRSVLFVKPNYWVVVDHVTGAGEHEVKRLFHFPLGEAKTEGNIVRTAFESGMNLQIQVADTSKLEMTKGWVPTEGAKAEEAPVATYVSKGALPLTLVSVLTPFADTKSLPKVEKVAGPNEQTQIRIAFPDGQTDEIALAAEPMALQIGDQKGNGRALLIRKGPQANATVALDGSIPLKP